MIRSVTTRTPEWTDEDRAQVLAFLDFEALTCNGCGGYLPETTDPEHEGRYRTDDPHRCHRCTAIAAKQENYETAKHPRAYVAWPTFLKEA